MSDYAQKYTNARMRLLALLSDLEWHSFRECEHVAGNRYAARALELRRLGYKIDDRPRTDDGKDYRLLSRTPGEPQPKRVKVFLEESDAREITSGRLTHAAIEATREALASFTVNKHKL